MCEAQFMLQCVGHCAIVSSPTGPTERCVRPFLPGEPVQVHMATASVDQPFSSLNQLVTRVQQEALCAAESTATEFVTKQNSLDEVLLLLRVYERGAVDAPERSLAII